MSTSHAVRASAKIFALLVLSLTLGACGTSNRVCPLAASCCAGACPVNPGPEFLYATSNTGQILTFTVDRNTGALSAPLSIPGPTTGFGIASTETHFLYVSDFQNAVIDAFSINPTSGALTTVPGSPFSLGGLGSVFIPAWLVPGSNLYATGLNGVASFAIGADGSLTTVSGSPFPAGVGAAQAALGLTLTTPTSYFLYVTDILDPNGSVSALKIDPVSGTLSLVGIFPTLAGSAPDGIVFDGTTGPFVFVALNISNKIAAFSVEQSTGALTPVPGSPFDTGIEPTFLALSSAPHVLYAVNRLAGTISAYNIAVSGALTPVAGSPFTAGTLPEGIALAGSFLYVANPASNSILGFNINSTTGALTPLSGSPFPASGALLLTVVQMPGQRG